MDHCEVRVLVGTAWSEVFRLLIKVYLEDNYTALAWLGLLESGTLAQVVCLQLLFEALISCLAGAHVKNVCQMCNMICYKNSHMIR